MSSAPDDAAIVEGLDFDGILLGAKGAAKHFVMFEQVGVLDLRALKTRGLVEDGRHVSVGTSLSGRQRVR